jgi:hypothetical protein
MTELIKRETLFAASLLALILGVFFMFYRIMVPTRCTPGCDAR